MKTIKPCGLIALALCLLWATDVQAQYAIPWYTIDGGGGYSTGGSFELEGTIGQHDAGAVMTGGSFQLAGGFWAGGSSAGVVSIAPDSFLVTRGTYVSGGVAELAASDNADLSIRRNSADIQSRTEFEIKAFSPFANPSSFEVKLEGSVFARSTVNQTIELFDYNAGGWELVDTRAANRFSDITVTVAATGNLSRFVEGGTNSIEARIRYSSTVARQQFSSNTDQFAWTISN